MEPESAYVPEYLEGATQHKRRRRRKGDTKKKAATPREEELPTSPTAAFFLASWTLPEK
jgi:hypothetical protein